MPPVPADPVLLLPLRVPLLVAFLQNKVRNAVKPSDRVTCHREGFTGHILLCEHEQGKKERPQEQSDARQLRSSEIKPWLMW